MPTTGSGTTDRLYETALVAFYGWCGQNGLHQHPIKPEQIAQYLRHSALRRGPSSVPVHLSAIARDYRSQGFGVDTKSQAIKAVTDPCRLAIRLKQARVSPREINRWIASWDTPNPLPAPKMPPQIGGASKAVNKLLSGK